MSEKYDQYGRMFYNPDFHPKHKTPWTNKDEQYLIGHYYNDGCVAVSYALGRTSKTIASRALSLRKQGRLKKPVSRMHRKPLMDSA